jgi:hypothetical protein
MNSVTFMRFQSGLASYRYRAEIPERELRKQGWPVGNDILVCSKHGWELRPGYKHIVFDISDDHFHGIHEPHYRKIAQEASLITCPTAEMAKIILRETGKTATVIPDPFEQRETKAKIHDALLWYGHASNAIDLERELPNLVGYKIEIVSNIKTFTQWSPANMDRAFNTAGLVVIPTGKSMAKSGNRAVEAIRRGLFVVANPLPAYADLGMWQGDIRQGVDWALSHRGEVLRRIKNAQDYVRHEYSPQRIGRMWAAALGTICTK